MAEDQEVHKLSLPQGPLYAFSLPQELLQVIQLRSTAGSAVADDDIQATAGNGQAEESRIHDSRSNESALRCNLCGSLQFESIGAQRAHFSSDWHRYNIKRSLVNKPVVGEQDWEGLVEGLDDSLSGTASSSDDDSESSEHEDVDNVSRILAKQKLSDTNGDSTDDVEAADAAVAMTARSPLQWFDAPQHIQDTQFGLYRTIFPSATRTSTSTQWVDELRKLQVTEDSSRLGKKAMAKLDGGITPPASRTWTLLAIGGGHFAGAIVSLVPQLQNRNGKIERELVILQSKTFHRYTTRRKQGGAQSANDQAKSKAKSAGAQIRRYNEAMLTSEVRELLGSWRTQIEASELVFLRAGKTSHRIFYDYEDAVLMRKDPRMRTFPFPTRRPTQAELVRCFSELTRVKISHFTAAQLAELEAAYRAAVEQARKAAQPVIQKLAPAKPEKPKMSKEEMLERDRWDRVLDMVKRDKLEAFRGFLEKQEQDGGDAAHWLGRLPSWNCEGKASPTVLHYAASNDSPEITRYLLEERRADPTMQSLQADQDGEQAAGAGTLPLRTPYECASSRAVRNVFRRVYADHPDWWAWEEHAKVPSKLTEEMESAQGAKKNERKSKLKDKMRERQAEREVVRQAEEEERRRAEAEEQRNADELRRNTPVTGPQRLGGGPPRFVQEQTTLKGLSEEARRRLDREKRLKAAEARSQQAKQQQGQ